MLSTFEEAFLG